MKRWAGYVLLFALFASASSCWNWNLAREWKLDPPDRPRVNRGKDGPSTPDWMYPPDSGSESLEDTDIHRTKIADSATVYVRLGLPDQPLLSDRTSVRIDFPVGHAGHPIGLAELAALAVADAPDHAGNRPSLRRMITRLGGYLSVGVGAQKTRFTVNIPTSNWQTALGEIVERARRQPVTPDQFRVLQSQLIRTYLDEWHGLPALGYAKQWLRHGDRTRTEIVSAIQDRYAAETMLFRRRFYRPQGTVVGVWLPNAEDADAITAGVKEALQTPPQTPAVAKKDVSSPPAPAPTSVRWIAGPGRSQVAVMVPLATATPEWLVMLECFTMGGIGGRLGEVIADKLDRELPMQVREIGDGNHRYVVMLATVDAETVPILWQAATSAWQSLSRIPPVREELVGAKSRVRLRLARRQDHADDWLASAADSSNGGPIQDLHRLEAMTHVRNIATEWSKTQLAMVVFGGKPPASIAAAVQSIELSVPELRRESAEVGTDEKTAAHYLALATQALGTKRMFRGLRGYEIRENWKDSDGLEVQAITSTLLPDELHRVLRVLGTRVETRVVGATGTEGIGKEVRELTAGEADEIRSEVNRHPLAILAAWSQGKLEFRLLGTRKHSGREVALLERVDSSRGRMRVTIEMRSGLIRTVETIQRRPDMGAIRLLDSYGDYRQMEGIRVPTHRVTTVGNGLGGTVAHVTNFHLR